MASDLISLAAGAGVALLVGNAVHHRKRADQLEESNARAAVAATDINKRLDRVAAKRGIEAKSPAAPTSAPTSSEPAPRRVWLWRGYDDAFAKDGGGLPVPYLRALAHGESDLKAASQTGDARGLFQIVPVVLRDYNRRHGTRTQPSDLYRPDLNVTIAASALRTIIASYAENHPDVPNLREDWTNAKFVELLTFGWNAGWSETAGVGHVVDYLTTKLGMVEMVDLDTVAQYAKEAGASRHLSNPRKVRYAKAVTKLYFAERDRDAKEGVGT